MTTITLDDILQTQNEPVSHLPLKTIIDAYFDGTKHMKASETFRSHSACQRTLPRAIGLRSVNPPMCRCSRTQSI